jgi:hypothetical protein
MSDVTVYAEALIAAVARGKRGSVPIPMYNSEYGLVAPPTSLLLPKSQQQIYMLSFDLFIPPLFVFEKPFMKTTRFALSMCCSVINTFEMM